MRRGVEELDQEARADLEHYVTQSDPEAYNLLDSLIQIQYYLEELTPKEEALFVALVEYLHERNVEAPPGGVL